MQHLWFANVMNVWKLRNAEDLSTDIYPTDIKLKLTHKIFISFGIKETNK